MVDLLDQAHQSLRQLEASIEMQAGLQHRPTGAQTVSPLFVPFDLIDMREFIDQKTREVRASQ